jgi:hypothetical protein
MQSEFATLSDLAINRGVSHSELIFQVHQSVLSEYRQRYPNSPVGVSVVVDETTGNVRIFSGDKDITPKEFALDAARIARQCVIGYLGQSSNLEYKPRIVSQTEVLQKKSIAPWLVKIIFWGYNIYLMFVFGIITLMILGSGVNNLGDMLNTTGVVKVGLYIFLILIPPLTVYYSLRSGISKDTGNLARLLFLLEMPLIILTAIPILLFGQFTGTIWLFTTILILLPMALYTYRRNETEINIRSIYLVLGLRQVIVTTITYLIFLFSFLVPPIFVGAAKILFGDLFVNFSSGYGPYNTDLIGLIIRLSVNMFLFALILTFIAAPFIILILIWRSLISARQIAIKKDSERKVNKFQILILILWLLITALVSYQGYQNPLLTQLSDFNTTPLFEEKEKLAKNLILRESQLKQAVLDVNNFRGKYLFSRDDQIIKNIYVMAFSMDESTAGFVDSMFSVAAYPFIYSGPTDKDQKLSMAFFDLFGYSPYNSSIYGIYPQPEVKNVRLVGRVVNANISDKLAATVTVKEMYTNKTYTNQEVIYEFSLPEEAVVTDLKLGPNLEFNGQIAPKGAARATYEQEVNRSRDPALLEKTGPRQYRLRVFPVPGLNDRTLGGKNQQVQFTYIVPLLPDGFALPVYHKVSNIAIDSGSVMVYQLNGQPAGTNKDKSFLLTSDGRIPEDICKAGTVGTVKIGDINAKLIFHGNDPALAGISTCPAVLKDQLPLRGSNIAVFLDISRKNKNLNPVSNIKEYFRAHPNLLTDNTVTLYRFNSAMSKGTKLTLSGLDSVLDPIYFGKSDLSGAMARPNKPSGFDAAIIVMGTEESGLTTKEFPFNFNGPVYLVHPGSSIPPYSAKFTAGIIKSRGKTVNTIAEAFADFTFYKNTLTNPNIISAGLFYNIVTDSELKRTPGNTDGSTFSVKWEEVPTTAENPLSYTVANGYFLNQVENFKYDVSSNLPFLDAAHAWAKKIGIVTPYSSLIALVNEAQQQNLDRQTQSYDRYADQSQLQIITNPQVMPISRGLLGNISPMTDFKSIAPDAIGGGSYGVNSLMLGGTTTYNVSRLGGIVNLLSGLPGVIFFGMVVLSGLGFIGYIITLIRKPHH